MSTIADPTASRRRSVPKSRALDLRRSRSRMRRSGTRLLEALVDPSRAVLPQPGDHAGRAGRLRQAASARSATRPSLRSTARDPEYIVLDQTNPKGEGADAWHSDNTFMSGAAHGLDPSRAVQIPEVGVATPASRARSRPTKRCRRRSESSSMDCSAVHDITKPLQEGHRGGARRRWTSPRSRRSGRRSRIRSCASHPVTGRKRALREPQLDDPSRGACPSGRTRRCCPC